MKAGNNLLIEIIRFSYPQDDDVGGALPSGTVIHSGVQAREQDATPIQEYAIQGVGTNKLHQLLVYPASLDVKEYDQVRVVSPPNHHWYGLNMRIDTVQFSNFHPADPRSYILLTVTRETRHGNNFQ